MQHDVRPRRPLTHRPQVVQQVAPEPVVHVPLGALRDQAVEGGQLALGRAVKLLQAVALRQTIIWRPRSPAAAGTAYGTMRSAGIGGLARSDWLAQQ